MGEGEGRKFVFVIWCYNELEYYEIVKAVQKNAKKGLLTKQNQSYLLQLSKQMQRLSLVQHLRILKTVNPQNDTKVQKETQLPIFNKIKKQTRKNRKGGIFQNISFCPIYKQDSDEEYRTLFNEMIVGLYHQGAKIVQFSEKMSEQEAKFIVIFPGEDVEMTKQKIARKVRYNMIVSSNFVRDSLKSLKLKDCMKYVLFDNTEDRNKHELESELALKILEKEEIHEHLIRPKLDQNNQIQGRSKSQKMGMQHRIKKVEMKEEKEKEKEKEEKTQNETKNGAKNEEYQQKHECSDEEQEMYQHQKVEMEEHCEQKNLKKSENHKSIYSKKQQQKKQKVQQKQQYLAPQDPFVPWQPKSDRKKTWYVPPKNLASYAFKKNIFICQKLQQIQEYYRRQNDPKQYIYQHAVTALKVHNKQIKFEDDLKKVQGLAPAMMKKAGQILRTGWLAKCKSIREDREYQTCLNLEKVWSVGYKKAKELYHMGIKSVDDLSKKDMPMPKNMQTGIKYYKQFSKRIPREKVTRMFEVFKKIFYSLVHSDKLHYIEVVGSYRRGKATCGDIDILICRRDGSIEAKLLQNLIRQLQNQKFITQNLTIPRLFDGKGASNYMGVCQFQDQHHRIDIKHYPINQYAFALMYFTGSDRFNKQMRMASHNMGLQLSDHGLKPKQRNGQYKMWSGGRIPDLKTQEEIFKFLKQDYCTPAERQL